MEGFDDTKHQKEQQSQAGSTSTNTTTTLTTTSSLSQRTTRNKTNLKRKVENDNMDTSNGQSSMEGSRFPQGSSPNEGGHF